MPSLVESSATWVDREPMLELMIEVGPPQDLGASGGTLRRFIPIVGGTVCGEQHGVVVAGGGDSQSIRPDGTIEIEARYALAIDGGRVEVESTGLRTGPPDVLARLAAGEVVPATDYYFRTLMRFRTDHPPLASLTRLLALGIGQRRPAGVHLAVHRIL